MAFKDRWELIRKAFSSGYKKVTGRTGKSDAKKQQGFEIDDKIIWMFARSDPVIWSAIQVTVDNVVPGFYFETIDDSTEAEQQKAIMEEFAEMDNWMQSTRNVTANMCVFDDCFEEMIPALQGGLTGTAVIDTPSIKIVLDDNGEVKEYQQWIDGKKVATLKPEHIVHYRLNVFGDRDTGLSNLEPVLFSAAVKRFAEKFNAAIFENQKPRGVWLFPASTPKEVYDETTDLIIEGKDKPQTDLFLRGDNLEFKSFANMTDMEYQAFLKYVREEIVTGMMVPPILLGLPEGSNKANSDIQMQAFDRRVKSIQGVIEYQKNQRIIKEKFGFDKIRFRLDASTKRDTLQELEIANRMFGIATLNEVRKEIGLPELDPVEYPDADNILTKAPAMNLGGENLSNNREDEAMDDNQKMIKKNLNLPVSKKDEERVAGILKRWAEEVKLKLKAEIDNNKEIFKKQITDPDEILKKVLAVVSVEGLKDELNQLLVLGYAKGLDSMAKELNRTFSPDVDALNFLKTYTFDLVRGMNDRLKNNLRRILRNAVINGQSIPTVKKFIDAQIDREIGNSETLARTELNRASNKARLQAAKDSGVVKKKWISITKDARTSDISKAMDAKYGSEDKAIPVDDVFRVIVRGKTIEGDAPPFHPNERDALMFVTG